MVHQILILVAKCGVWIGKYWQHKRHDNGLSQNALGLYYLRLFHIKTRLSGHHSR
jgi:hypothetical protein